jgi:hypothetical protein
MRIYQNNYLSLSVILFTLFIPDSTKTQKMSNPICREYLFEKVRNFRTNALLLHEIEAIAQESYQDYSGLFERDSSFCDEIYLLRHPHGSLLSFFMVKFLFVETLPTYFLGWSCCSQAYKNSGLTKRLYQACFADCRKAELTLRQRIVCWWTTATPIAYYWFNKNMERCQPDITGKILEESIAIFDALRRTQYINAHCKEEPIFILRGFAGKTHYSSDEASRLKEARTSLRLNVFDQFQLNETDGDRFLMVGYVPNAHSYI